MKTLKITVTERRLGDELPNEMSAKSRDCGGKSGGTGSCKCRTITRKN